MALTVGPINKISVVKTGRMTRTKTLHHVVGVLGCSPLERTRGLSAAPLSPVGRTSNKLRGSRPLVQSRARPGRVAPSEPRSNVDLRGSPHGGACGSVRSDHSGDRRQRGRGIRVPAGERDPAEEQRADDEREHERDRQEQHGGAGESEQKRKSRCHVHILPRSRAARPGVASETTEGRHPGRGTGLRCESDQRPESFSRRAARDSSSARVPWAGDSDENEPPNEPESIGFAASASRALATAAL